MHQLCWIHLHQVSSIFEISYIVLELIQVVFIRAMKEPQAIAEDHCTGNTLFEVAQIY